MRSKLAQKLDPLGLEIAETMLVLFVQRPEVLGAAAAPVTAESRANTMDGFILLLPMIEDSAMIEERQLSRKGNLPCL